MIMNEWMESTLSNKPKCIHPFLTLAFVLMVFLREWLTSKNSGAGNLDHP